MVFNDISCNIDEVLSINPSADVFVFGDFNICHKGSLSYSGWTDRPARIFPSTFWNPENGSKNSILNWVMKLSLIKFPMKL